MEWRLVLSIRELLETNVSSNNDCFIARRLLTSILNRTYDQVFFNQDSIYVSDHDLNLFLQYFSRYKNGEPISKIIGKRNFWKDEFVISKDVLDPRQDSETLIEAVLSYVNTDRQIKFLDIGTGSGCLIISILQEYKNSTGVAVDISEKALEIAQTNAHNILDDVRRISFKRSDFAKDINGKFDVIISNPPYIKSSEINSLDDNVRLYDPLLALDGGASGLVAYEAIAVESQRLLKEDGLIFLEIGRGQKDEVCSVFNSCGYTLIEFYHDYQSIERVLVFSRS